MLNGDIAERKQSIPIYRRLWLQTPVFKREILKMYLSCVRKVVCSILVGYIEDPILNLMKKDLLCLEQILFAGEGTPQKVFVAWLESFFL